MKSTESSSVTADRALYSAAAVTPYRFEDLARHDTAMREALEVVTFTAENGQAFSGLHLNRGQQDEPAIIRLNSFHSSSTTRQQKYTAYQFAAGHPDQELFVVDFPSHGRSDRPTGRQYLELLVHRDITGIAEAQADAVSARLSTPNCILVADSLGGQLTPLVAQQLAARSIDSKLIVAFEPTGMHSAPARASTSKKLTPDANGHSAYHQGPDNQSLDASYQTFSVELDQYGYNDMEYSSANLRRRDPSLVAILKSPRSSFHNGHGLKHFEEALRIMPNLEVAIVSGGLSKLCNWSSASIEVVAAQQEFPGRFSWDVWPNDSHSMGIAEQQPRMVTFTQGQIAKRLNFNSQLVTNKS